MKQEAYKQYLHESDNWLHRGRRALLAKLLQRIYRFNSDAKNLDVLEIGAGSGKSAGVLAEYGKLDVVEIETTAIKMLEQNSSINRIYRQEIPFELSKRYDMIVAMDVLEHIQDDQSAFDWMMGMLNPGGILLITVPSFQWLFSEHDKALNHFRRYNLAGLDKLNRGRFQVVARTYFNFLLFPLAVISRFAKMLSVKQGEKSSKQSSEFSGAIDRVFFALLQLEAFLIKAGIKMPWGLTTVMACKK